MWLHLVQSGEYPQHVRQLVGVLLLQCSDERVLQPGGQLGGQPVGAGAQLGRQRRAGAVLQRVQQLVVFGGGPFQRVPVLNRTECRFSADRDGVTVQYRVSADRGRARALYSHTVLVISVSVLHTDTETERQTHARTGTHLTTSSRAYLYNSDVTI